MQIPRHRAFTHISSYFSELSSDEVCPTIRQNIIIQCRFIFEYSALKGHFILRQNHHSLAEFAFHPRAYLLNFNTLSNANSTKSSAPLITNSHRLSPIISRKPTAPRSTNRRLPTRHSSPGRLHNSPKTRAGARLENPIEKSRALIRHRAPARIFAYVQFTRCSWP